MHYHSLRPHFNQEKVLEDGEEWGWYGTRPGDGDRGLEGHVQPLGLRFPNLCPSGPTASYAPSESITTTAKMLLSSKADKIEAAALFETWLLKQYLSSGLMI